MSSAMFIHRTAYLQAQVRQCRADGYEDIAVQLECLIRRIKSGNIKTVTQLNKAQEEIKWTQ